MKLNRHYARNDREISVEQVYCKVPVQVVPGFFFMSGRNYSLIFMTFRNRKIYWKLFHNFNKTD